MSMGDNGTQGMAQADDQRERGRGVPASPRAGALPTASIDWTDIKFCLCVGGVFAALKGVSLARPDLQLRSLDSLIPFLLVVEYTLVRARKQPEKLDEWGLTTPLPTLAWTVMALMLAVGIAALAALGLLLAGTLTWKFVYIPKMIEYLVSAFPQQFALCSVGLVSLSKLRMFHGNWRLPLCAAFLFALAHFWTPHLIPGTRIPLQMVGTFPFAFAMVWYFIKFRSILPLTVAHAVLYIILNNWVEAHL